MPEIKLRSRIPSRLAQLNKPQSWLATHLGVTTGYVSRLCQGKHFPRITTAYKVAGILQCTIEDLWYPVE